MLKNFFVVQSFGTKMDLMLLFLRLFFGYAFIIHGYGKILHPFSWMGAESIVPGIFQALAALAEFGGGISIILGFLSRLSAFGLICTMVVAVFTSKFINGLELIGKKGGPSYELAFVYLILSILFFIVGTGKFSIDKKLFSPK